MPVARASPLRCRAAEPRCGIRPWTQPRWQSLATPGPGIARRFRGFRGEAPRRSVGLLSLHGVGRRCDLSVSRSRGWDAPTIPSPGEAEREGPELCCEAPLRRPRACARGSLPLSPAQLHETDSRSQKRSSAATQPGSRTETSWSLPFCDRMDPHKAAGKGVNVTMCCIQSSSWEAVRQNGRALQLAA